MVQPGFVYKFCADIEIAQPQNSFPENADIQKERNNNMNIKKNSARVPLFFNSPLYPLPSLPCNQTRCSAAISASSTFPCIRHDVRRAPQTAAFGSIGID
uniref:Uncharacterized protein n=1 Tax=Solanum lycopersicum TaxID=4081 RepID=A0A3Q7ELD5_SOLLC